MPSHLNPFFKEWLGWLEPFLIGASIGAPAFLAWVAWDYWRASASARAIPQTSSRLGDAQRQPVE